MTTILSTTPRTAAYGSDALREIYPRTVEGDEGCGCGGDCSRCRKDKAAEGMARALDHIIVAHDVHTPRLDMQPHIDYAIAMIAAWEKAKGGA